MTAPADAGGKTIYSQGVGSSDPPEEGGEGGEAGGGATVTERPERASTESPETVASRPRSSSDSPDTVASMPSLTTGTGWGVTSGEATVADAFGHTPGPAVEPGPAPVPATATQTGISARAVRTVGGASLSLATAAEALHHEEVRRTRQFIALGWLISLAGIGAVPLVDAPWWMDIAFVAALVWGIVMSFYFHQRFKDPSKFSGQQMLVLGIFAVINAHVAIAYFGVFSAASMITVLGIHFIARSEAARAVWYLFLTCVTCYLAVTGVLIAGVVPDPGVFASDDPLSRTTLIAGAVFVTGNYCLAYYTGRSMRKASLTSISGLQQQTRLAAQRKALMDELRADLERALRVGGPGRHTDQVHGSFKLGNVLGRGAMGEVYEAHHVTTNEPAAVKLLRRELLADPTHVARFLREAKASGALASPFVVRVFDAAAETSTTPYLAMERLHGQTLAELLRRDARLPPAKVVEMVRHAGAGVDAAAAAGIVHRDLKPQNLMLARAPGGGEQWKILDFGVATLVDDTGTLTQGGIVGTPSYMAPEQAQGKRVDARADVYALAAVAYRCLTGRHPFTAPDTPALLYAVVHRMPMRPTALGTFDPDLDRWVALALAKEPDDRIPTGVELADTLTIALEGGFDPKLRKRADALIKRHGWGDA